MNKIWYNLNKLIFTIVFIFNIIITQISGSPKIIKIGGLFSKNELEQELAFRFAVDSINSDSSILFDKYKLEAKIEHLERDDSFKADRKVCGLLREGVASILGPSSSTTSMHVQSICDVLEIPHVETRWDSGLRDYRSVNLHPKPSMMAKAYMDLVKYFQWKQFCVVYEEYDGLARLQDFLKQNTDNWKVKFYKFTPGQPYRDTYWEIKRSGETNIILDVRTENINRALKHAQQVGLITENHNYIITSLDLPAIDMEDYIFSKTKITSFKLTDSSSPDLMKLQERMPQLMEKHGNRTMMGSQFRDIRTESALTFDAVKLIALAMQEMDRTQTIDVTPTSCENGAHWQHGSSLLNYLRTRTFHGASGLVTFESSRHRPSFTLSVMTVIPRNDSIEGPESGFGDGLQKIGTWRIDKFNHQSLDMSEEGNKIFLDSPSKSRETYRITTILNDPFTMLKSSHTNRKGNDRFEGFSIDLAEELSKILNFNYQIQVVKDKSYGSFKTNSTTNQTYWNGMIGEVIRGDADMAIADLTITSKREEAVDFSHPFMNTGISILFRKPTKKVTTLFSFLSPFSMVVWVYVVGAYVGVSVILFVVGRLSPYEWDNPHPCRQDDQVLENEFSLLNSFWFTIGSLMQQGSDLTPKSMSSRTIAAIWYFFTLIMISSYTANLAAFLTVEKVVYPIEDAKDLAYQKEIGYGCISTGSTKAFFAETKVPDYQKMYQFMESNSHMYVTSNEQGKERVSKGNYAFFMESAAIEFIVERECNLTQIGQNLDSKGYGIATREGDPLARRLTEGILKLQEKNVLQILKDRWWKQKRGGGACLDDSKKGSSSVTELSLGNVGGVFVVLLGGLVIALGTAVLEFAWRARKMTRQGESMCAEMGRDLKFALSCQSSTKSARNSVRFAGFAPTDRDFDEKPPPMAGFITNY
ncbi:glutamate receptor ionotropic, kainate 2-like [Brevipalpus obovatus]|uniref:glutamate receptor ionotropic, kainate 2-like n=1 Tax=Brevipalpus obovatus TaxID=246614 RepID=UPI003D9F1010